MIDRQLLAAFAAVFLGGLASARQTTLPGAGAGSSAAPPAGAAEASGLLGVTAVELLGRPLAVAPWFEFTRVAFENAPLAIAVDPSTHPQIAGRNAYLYVVAHRTPAQWLADRSLVDVRKAAQAVFFGGADVQGNVVPLLFGPIPGEPGIGFGRAYDLVLDLDFDGVLGAGDWIDGLGVDPGFWSVERPEVAGPLAVSTTTYSGGTWLGQKTYYPTAIATLGALPLVVVSHGNGHSYLWYDHVGTHLASHGYVVMSHQNNTGPGVETASTTTLTNTDWFLANHATVAGGALAGHVDGHKLVWLGHSRGGEGVVRAYDRVFEGTYTPAQFTKEDVVLVSSIAPTDFLGPAGADPHDVDFHLWVGGADDDVSGCAGCSLCQSFHLLDRASGNRSSISLHGVGHGAFHAAAESLVAFGPCIVSRADTHVVMKGMLLPLVELHARGNEAARDFLWRQWETFRPPGAPTNSCIVVDLTHRLGPGAQSLAVDDYQSAPSNLTSSSGAAVTFDVESLVEARLDDLNGDFTDGPDPMNGMTGGGSLDTTAGCTFEWNGVDRVLTFALPAGPRDLRGHAYLSFRACQQTRDPLTTAKLEDLVFEVGLRDAQGAVRTIGIGAYGGGIEEPYQRTGCGVGVGWGNEFETIRIALGDFARAGSALDLAAVSAIEFRFGPSHGSPEGRIGLDDVEVTRR